MATLNAIEIGLNAAIIAIVDNNPCVLRVPGPDKIFADALPYGPFDPAHHRTMEIGLRQFVEDQTALKVGYVEQLYTFGDRGRYKIKLDDGPHIVSVGYLALTRIKDDQFLKIQNAGGALKNCYQHLPWEDWRKGRPAILDEAIFPALNNWLLKRAEATPHLKSRNENRVRMSFGSGGFEWDEERVLERYELLYSAGLLDEAVADGRYDETQHTIQFGHAMLHDHRRILATALSRLRSKLKYRPVIFELMPDEFTLLDLQKTVECIFGRAVHKQNFRRLVEGNKLVEATGATSLTTGGRPAALFRFRGEVLVERPAPGLKVGKG